MTAPSAAAEILILLPVYNGAAFLPHQLDSLLAQTWTAWRLICRDDGSSDTSAAVLADYQARYPDKVTLLCDQDGNLGPAGSFSRLMEHALAVADGAPQGHAIYVALADQDDSWFAEKLEVCLAALKAQEQEQEQQQPGLPVLVHSDLRVVGPQGQLIAPSFTAYQGLDPSRTDLESQLAINTVTGCTALMNLALLRRALPVPTDAMMHDWWLALVASAFGKLVYIDQPLVNYRQHGGNTIGARPHERLRWSWRLLQRLFRRRDPEAEALIAARGRQAAAFCSRYGEHLTPRQQRRARTVQAMPRWSLVRQRLWFHLMR